MKWTRGAWLGLLLVLAPAAQASVSQGELTVQGIMHLPQSSALEGRTMAIFANQSDQWERMRIEAASMRVHHYWSESFAVYNDSEFIFSVPGEPNRQSADYANATLDTDGTGPGWIGFYPEPSAEVRFEPRALPLRVLPANSTGLGTNVHPTERSDPNDPQVDVYERVVDVPHAYFSAPGRLVYQGQGAVKLMGPAVSVAEDGQTAASFETGRSHDAAWPVGAGTMRTEWLVIEFDGTLELLSRAPISVAFGEGNVFWQGRAAFGNAAGVVETEATLYEVRSGYATLDGTMAGSLQPIMDEGKPAFAMALSGELASTSMPAAATRTALPPGGSGLPGLASLLVVIGLATAGGGWALRAMVARRQERERHSVEDCVEFANLAAEQGRFQVALEWMRRARAQAPRSARLATDEAFYLQQTGHVEAALAAYDEASALSEDGEADYLAASLQLSLGLGLDEAEARVVRALERTPTLALEVEDEPVFDALRGRPRFDRALRAAFAALGER